ncbi:phosphatidate cytidylyltransferase [Clostridium sp. D46t1_190503_E9]|uniref:phosphatidate cytidylyltransferase n=1 Tax=Clostridium sp. D46t1_190503_E9 TaxID=2787137 RepID=UPI0018985ED9|nr:phosphatidate cytidylyltransferase [Clostridium sp. D46t1_190503_E9]
MKLNSRYLGAAMIAPFILFILLGGIWLKSFTIVISVCGLYEFYKALKEKKFKPVPIVGYALLAIFYLIGNNFEEIMYIIVLAAIVLLIIPIINLKYTFIDVSITLLGFLYIGVLFSFIPIVNSKTGGEYLVWLIFLGSWVADTTAYYAGKYLGKRKICPEVSPKKTVAGSVGGFLGSTIGCGIYGLIIVNYVPEVSIIHFFLIGALCGIMGQFGDLVASSVKRYVGIKDYSNLIPGHGGILDRFDSILFNAAVVFYYLTFIVGI